MSSPSVGNTTRGISAVAGSGMASVIHHTPMSTAVAAVSLALWGTSCGISA